MSIRFLFVCYMGIAPLWACRGKKELAATGLKTYQADTIEVQAFARQPRYHSTPPKSWNLIHTQLDITPDFETRSIPGKAVLRLAPGFYPTDSLRLDARYFEVRSVVSAQGPAPKYWHYDSSSIYVRFAKPLSFTDTLSLEISYRAFPEKAAGHGGKAVTGSQGFYFVSPNAVNPDKPFQFWTQGETEYNANWFPTLDAPNQKMTQELSITLPDSMVSLSNGRFAFSTLNTGKTHTDYWIQNKPHSPYLAMVAGGKFSVYRDKWRELEVNYYVEPAYAADAPFIFGRTPDMMEFFSNLLQTPFPWDKYSQMVVRDFVSGAMENTSATVHGDFVQKHKRELLDEPQEGIIAHELFHQWFGNLVSCEDWGNLALNESFATYGEYLWVAADKGFHAASSNMYHKRKSYFLNGPRNYRPLVYHGYQHPDDMFDVHSYPKGAAILHLLRHITGDQAFFESLHLYLHRYAHRSAEMHQLRCIMEEVTGRDLNPFFNQWVFAPGHPILDISHRWADTDSTLEITFLQTQNLLKMPLYQLDFVLGFHGTAGTTYQTVHIEDERTVLSFRLSEKPEWIELDTSRHLLAEWIPRQSRNAWLWQLKRSSHLEARMDAFEALMTDTTGAEAPQAAYLALHDPCPELIHAGLNRLSMAFKWDAGGSATRMSALRSGPRSEIRSAALAAWIDYAHPDNLEQLLNTAINDSSYRVVGKALRLMADADSIRALTMAQQFERAENHFIQHEVMHIYSIFGGPSRFGFFADRWRKSSKIQRFRVLSHFKTFILRQSDIKVIGLSVDLMGPGLSEIQPVWLRSATIDLLIDVEDKLNTSKRILQDELSRIPYEGNRRIEIENRLEQSKAIQTNINRYFNLALSRETDKGLRIKLTPP